MTGLCIIFYFCKLHEKLDKLKHDAFTVKKIIIKDKSMHVLNKQCLSKNCDLLMSLKKLKNPIQSTIYMGCHKLVIYSLQNVSLSIYE